MFKRLEDLFEKFLGMGVPGYDCVIMKDGRCIYRHFGGYSDVEKKIPVNGTERLELYSCSKVITCVAAMQLYEKGLFKLEDKLSDYMPEFENMTVKCGDEIRKAQNPILIEHLFTMSAGFSYNTKSPQILIAKEETDGKCPTRETMKYLAKEPLLFEPGTRWEYSLCHDVLAALVEVLSGERFGDYVKKNIFDPLGMTRSTFMLPDNERNTIAQKYRYNKTTKQIENCTAQPNMFIFGSMYESGGAGCISTVNDYIKFLEALRIGNTILKSETIDFMCIDRLTEQTRPYYWYTDHGYGLGVRCPRAPFSTDFGWGGAAGAFLLVDRINGITAYYSQHLLNSPNAKLRKTILGPTITDCVLGRTTQDVHSPDVSEDTLSQFL